MPRQMKESGIEWIGAIPIDWSIVPQKYVMHKEKILCEHYNGEDIISLSMQGVRVRDLDAGGKMPTTFDGYQYVEPEDLLMCLFDIDVTPRCVGIVHNNGLTSPAYSRFKVHKGYLNTYYDYLLRFIDDEKVFVHLAKNLRSSLTEADFGSIKTIAPSFEEQQIIVDYLDKQCAHIDAVLEQTRISIEDYKALKQALITKAVTKGIIDDRQMKDSGYEFIGYIPAEWEVVKLRNIGTPQNGISKGGEFFGSGYPFVSYGDVYRNITLPEKVNGLIQSTDEEQERYSVQAGDIFFTRTSETIDEVGFSSVCEKTIPNATFAGFLIRIRPTNEILRMGFSKYYFRSSHHRVYLAKEMNLVTRASLGQTLLKGMPVLVPSKEEQDTISAYLNEKCAEIDRLIEKKIDFLKNLENYKKSMIYEYVTGKKEVPQS